MPLHLIFIVGITIKTGGNGRAMGGSRSKLVLFCVKMLAQAFQANFSAQNGTNQNFSFALAFRRKPLC